PARRPVRARRLRHPAAPDPQDAGGLPRAHPAGGAEAARGGRDDPPPEPLARAGEPAAARALDGGDGVALGNGRRARLLHRRPLDADDAHLPRRPPRSGGAGRAPPVCRDAVLPALRDRSRADPAARGARARGRGAARGVVEPRSPTLAFLIVRSILVAWPRA